MSINNMKSSQIKDLQKYLQVLSDKNVLRTRPDVSGKYDMKTMYAIMELQSKVNATTDGR